MYNMYIMYIMYIMCIMYIVYIMYIICCINKRTVETRDIIIYFLFLLLSLYNGILKIALEWLVVALQPCEKTYGINLQIFGLLCCA